MTPSLGCWEKVSGKSIILILLLMALRNQIPHRYTVSPPLSRIDLFVGWRSSHWNNCAWLLMLSPMVHSIFLKLFFVMSWLTQITPPTMPPSLHLTLHSSRPSRTPVNHGTRQPLLCATVIGSTCLHGLLGRVSLTTLPDSTDADATGPSPTDPSTARPSCQKGWWWWWKGRGTIKQQ